MFSHYLISLAFLHTWIQVLYKNLHIRLFLYYGLSSLLFESAKVFKWKSSQPKPQRFPHSLYGLWFLFLLPVCLFWVVNWIWSQIDLNFVYGTRLEYLEILFGALFPHLISFPLLQLESTNMITGIKLCMFQRNIYFWFEYKIHDYQNWKSLADSLSFVAITGLAAPKLKFSVFVTSNWSRMIAAISMHILTSEDRSGLPLPTEPRQRQNLCLLKRMVKSELSKDTMKTRWWAKWSRYTERNDI